MPSCTAHTVHVLPVTRATTANLMPVVSHKTSNRVGTESIRPMAATALARSGGDSSMVNKSFLWRDRVDTEPDPTPDGGRATPHLPRGAASKLPISPARVCLAPNIGV